MIHVELLKFPGRIMSFSLEDNSTVRDLIDVATSESPGLDISGEKRVNNRAVNDSTRLYDGDRLVITKKVKGNQVSIKVTKFPGRAVDLMLDEGSSVQDAIDQANLGDVSGYQARMDGVEVERNRVIPDDGSVHRVILTKKVKGNK